MDLGLGAEKQTNTKKTNVVSSHSQTPSHKVARSLPHLSEEKNLMPHLLQKQFSQINIIILHQNHPRELDFS